MKVGFRQIWGSDLRTRIKMGTMEDNISNKRCVSSPKTRFSGQKQGTSDFIFESESGETLSQDVVEYSTLHHAPRFSCRGALIFSELFTINQLSSDGVFCFL